MCYKIFIKSFFITSLLLIGTLPALNLIFYPGHYSRLCSTDRIEGKIHYYFYSHYQLSLIPDKVIIGKNKFLFLGNSHNESNEKANGTFKYQLKEVASWSKKVKQLQSWYECNGIKFVVVIAPDKYSIYPEKVPDWMNKSPHTITDDATALMMKEGVNFIDLRMKLLQSKHLGFLFYYTDHHWNDLAASIGYEQTINYLNSHYSNNLQKTPYQIHKTTRPAGDLAKFMKLETILPNDYDVGYKLNFDYNTTVCIGKIDKNTNHLKPCFNETNHPIEINSGPMYIRNHKALNNSTLLLICDSFAIANSTLYNETFKTIYAVHREHVTGSSLGKFVRETKPDIVIYQIVERALYGDYWVQSLE